MLIKDLTIIFVNDRHDQIFEQALLAAAFAQEVIVFDQHSNNDWLSLEKKLKKLNPQMNFRIILRNSLILDFASVRNKIRKMVNTPWLMFLDSDEVLSSNNLELLPKMLADKTISAYRLKRVDYFHGQKLRYGETGNYQAVRLARSDSIKYLRPIHEVPLIKGRVEQSALIIKHFPHQNISDFLASVIHYAQLEANYRFAEKNNLSKPKIVWQLLVYPPGKFLLNYFFKLGVLDGFVGFSYAVLMSLHSLFVRIYLYEKYFLN